ncbi:MAG: hypothetical protein H7Z71_09020 [Moraxellaceae bacterium]|nr:hypothetical protein [Pseudobdellovibrionaceae bacterium]
MKQTLAIITIASAFLTSSILLAADSKITKKSFKTETQTITTTTQDAKTIDMDHQTATLTVEGMHCGGCKAMITKAVCGDAALSSQFDSCEFTKVDTKAQVGTMVIKYKKDAKVDLDNVEKAINGAGDYKLTKKEFSSKITN